MCQPEKSRRIHGRRIAIFALIGMGFLGATTLRSADDEVSAGPPSASASKDLSDRPDPEFPDFSDREERRVPPSLQKWRLGKIAELLQKLNRQKTDRFDPTTHINYIEILLRENPRFLKHYLRLLERLREFHEKNLLSNEDWGDIADFIDAFDEDNLDESFGDLNSLVDRMYQKDSSKQRLRLWNAFDNNYITEDERRSLWPLISEDTIEDTSQIFDELFGNREMIDRGLNGFITEENMVSPNEDIGLDTGWIRQSEWQRLLSMPSFTPEERRARADYVRELFELANERLESSL